MRRRILCVSPRYAPSFGTFEHAFPLTDGVRAFMPPQGLLTIAASLPSTWDVRFVDENIRRASAREMRWADAVFVSGMHIQRRQIQDILLRAEEAGRVTVLGGPSVSACPELYPGFDYLHVGELGDATAELVARLARSCGKPERQIVLRTRERRPLTDFPVPAYHLAPLRRYFLGSIQFSSGCPFRCEFCDIPALYGRNPRFKSPEQVVAELDALRAHGCSGAVYFVDDNFIGQRAAVRDLLPTLADWQQRNGYPYDFACEATVNLARCPEILAAMHEARFTTVFCGIETPEPDALRAISKQQNTSVPLLEAVSALNAHGLEVVAGIILGLDTDGPDTGDRLLDFVEASQIPMLTMNLLEALPRTPLWERLSREGRLAEGEGRESNVRFLRPYEEVVGTWRRCIREAYSPRALFGRFTHQLHATYPHRRPTPPRGNWRDYKRGAATLSRLLVQVGLLGEYRDAFWAFSKPLLRVGDIERVISVGLVAHHLITFARSAGAGRENASFYSAKDRPDAASTTSGEAKGAGAST